MEPKEMDKRERERQERFSQALARPGRDPFIPSPEDWAAWCDHPVTRFVSQAMLGAAMQQKRHFDSMAWSGTHIFESEMSRVELAKTMIRADIYSDFPKTEYGSFVAMFKFYEEAKADG